jgi:hypothetical protein
VDSPDPPGIFLGGRFCGFGAGKSAKLPIRPGFDFFMKYSSGLQKSGPAP